MSDVTYPNGWTLCRHAQLRMDEMGISAAKLFETLEDAVLTYPGRPGTERQVRVRDDLAVVVCETTLTVVTLLWAGACGRSPSGTAE